MAAASLRHGSDMLEVVASKFQAALRVRQDHIGLLLRLSKGAPGAPLSSARSQRISSEEVGAT